MARTPLANAIESAVAQIANDELRTTRRGLIRQASAAVAGTTLLGTLASTARAARGQPRIAVIGAGLAGLTCAYRLQQAGLIAHVYEAADRIGGRCHTGRGEFADGQIYEHGGELIDTDHHAIRNLTGELGLELDNLLAAERPGTRQLGHFFGRPYTYDQMVADFQAVLPQMARDVNAAGYATHHHSYTKRGYELDHTSIYGYIERHVPGGHGSPLGALLDVAYNVEYGAETSAQSSLNLLYLIGYSAPHTFATFGSSDEKYRVRGGNDQIAAGLASKLGAQISVDTALIAIARRPDLTFRLTFTAGSSTFDRAYDHVVLALPFSTLRTCDFSRAGFSAVKTKAISELGMGTNTKVHVQFTSRFWRDQGCNGETYSDRRYQNTWEVSRAQSGRSGLLAWYTGGKEGVAAGGGTPHSQARTFLEQIEPALPGATANWNGRAARDYWTGYEWTKGSYSYWRVGQYTSFSGVEGERSGNCYFCGEHTSVDSQGYLNGAVATGEDAGRQVIRRI